jgi:general secretion pathway protein G
MKRRFYPLIRSGRSRSHRGSPGTTLLELTMVVVILGIIGWVVLPRLSGGSLDSKRNACYVSVADIEVQAELWYRNKGTWPATDLSNMGADVEYCPDGLPLCPVNGTAYVLDGATHQVIGHNHPLP